LEQQGLGSYVSPELTSQINSLQNRMHARNALQMAAGGMLGASFGGAHGEAPAIGLGLFGAGVGKPIINYLQARLPMDKIAEVIQKRAKKTYPLAKNAILPNILTGANQNGS
jgi:uncharacterized protein YcfJ